jgi:hypothetical protein
MEPVAPPGGPSGVQWGADGERIARLEERMAQVQGLLEEIRREQRNLADVVARASGGLRVLLLLGGLAGLAGTLRGVAGWASGVWGHGQ